MKKLFVLILCFSMVLGICGCSSAETESEVEIIDTEQIIVDENGNPITSDVPDSSEEQTSSNGENLNPNNPNAPAQNGAVIDFDKTVEIDICDDVVRGYLDATSVDKQYYWLSEYSGTKYDYQIAEFDWVYDGSTVFTMTISENADFSNATSFEVRTAFVESTAFVPGKTYYWKITGNITDNLLGGGKIKIKNAPVRWIKVEGSGNVRDMGGWKTESGKTVKYEMMYRGKALDDISDAGKTTIKQLGIKTEVDIRATRNNPNPPQISGMNYKFFSTEAQYDRIFSSGSAEEVKANYKEIFKILSDKSNYPIYTHCSAGADRTGTFAFITNGLLGVSYEDLTRDFELTSFSSSGKRWRGSGAGGTFTANDLVMQEDSNNYVAWGKLYEEMMEQYGTGDGKLSSAIENYLITYVGVPKSQIDSFKAIMLK